MNYTTKTLFSIIFLLIFSFNSLFAQKENPKIEIEGTIKNVTLFLNEAMIEKTAELSLKKGDNNILLVGNSSNMNHQTLQFYLDNDSVIINDFYLTSRLAYNNPNKKFSDKTKKQIKLLKDSIKNLEYKQTTIKDLINTLENEKRALDSMKSISNSQLIDSVGNIKEALIFYRKKSIEVNQDIQKANKDLIDIKEIIDKTFQGLELVLQGEELEKEKLEIQYPISINIFSPKDIKVNISYTYNVDNAHWYPEYDIKVYSLNEPIKFILKANVRQFTKEDWNDVNLNISSEKANKNTLNELYPYYLNIVKPILNNKEMEAMNEASVDAIINRLTKSPASINKPKQAIGELELDINKDFPLKNKYTIPSNNEAKIISLQTKEEKAIFEYISIPKNSKNAFMIAKFPNWQNLELLTSEAYIYINNRFIKNTILEPTTQDTLSIDMGEDKNVIVDRKVYKKSPEKANLFSSLIETNVNVQLEMKNNNSFPINLNLKDQVPISQNMNIKVSLGDIAGASFDEKTGELYWKIPLKEGERKVITFTYKVQYPRDSNIILN
ncbi:MAG: DUF4139 domain-containing protein [Bacteroidales bacterium]|jgi:uncharacterized protein (TIGR02231 family)|nr:DUF4139 domain-containing protein [Bacteroidales bacterium]